MKKNNYDEFQLLIRYKTAAQCLWIIFALTFVNGFINENFVWAPPSIQSLLIIMLTTMYFIVMTTLKGAYISNNEKNPIVTVICFGIVAIVNFIVFFSGVNGIGFDYIVKNNMLTSFSASLFMAIFFSISSLVSLYKFLKTRNLDDE